MTNGWDIDFDNPDNEEWYEYGIVDFGTFNKLHKVIEKNMVWFHKFDETSTEQRKDKRYERFEFIDIMTKNYYNYLCKEEDKLYFELLCKRTDEDNPLEFSERQMSALSIEIEKDIFASMKSVQCNELFDFDSPVYESEDEI